MSTSAEDPVPETHVDDRECAINPRTGELHSPRPGRHPELVRIDEDLYYRLDRIIRNEREEYLRKHPEVGQGLMGIESAYAGDRSRYDEDDDRHVVVEYAEFRSRKTGQVVKVRKDSVDYERLVRDPNFRPFPCKFDLYLKHGVDVEELLELK